MRIIEHSLRNYIHQTWLYFQAKDTFYTGNIQDINIEEVRSQGKIEYQIETTFLDRRRTISQSMTVNDDGIITGVRCGCKNNREDIGCIHLIAAVEAINDMNPNSFPFYYNYQSFLEQKRRKMELEAAKERIETSNKELFDLLDSIQTEKDTKLMASNEDPIHIHVDLENPMNNIGIFELGFMIGVQKMYRVKDIRQLVTGFSKKEVFSLGKVNSIQLKKENLDTFSMPILEFISNYALVEEWRRTAVITSDLLDDAYDMLNALPNDYYDFYLFDHIYKFPFTLKRDEDSYCLEINQEKFKERNFILSKINLYTFNNRELHRYHFDQNGQVGKLANFVYENNPLFIKKEKMKDFYLRMIQPNLDYLDIECDFDLSTFETVLSDIQIYSDLQDSQLQVWGKYHQDGEERTMFSGSNAPEILSIESIISNYANTIKDGVAIFKSRGSRVNSFLDQGIPLLMNQARVYVSEELMKLKNRRSVDLSIGIRIKNNLLELNIDTKDVSKDELIHILNAYRKKKKFYQLKNGQTIDLEEKSIQQLDDLSTQLNLTSKDLKQTDIQKPAYQAMHLEDGDYQIHSDETIDMYTSKLEEVKSRDLILPDKYKDIVREYQKEGIEWLDHLNTMDLNGILADDMGLGKTLQVLVFLENYISKEFPSLIVCPSSLMYNWEGEIKKFNINIDYVCVNGNQDERKVLIQQNHDLYITTYDYLKRDVEEYKEKEFEYIILDEAQYIKNPKTQNAQCVKLLKSKQRLALTGTPIENSLSELWSIFDFLLPGYLYNLSYFVKNFEKPIRIDKNEKAQNTLKKLVEPFILRRTKAQVLTDLPDKVEKEMWIDFSKDEKNLYLANLARVNEELREQLKLDHMDSILILSMMTRLRQICCEPRLLYDEIKDASTKLSMCVNLIETLKENNKKVLLFSSFTSIFDMLIKEFEQKGIQYHLLTGSTNKEKRKQEVEAFQNDDSDVFLISLKAGGTGLNLTAAQAVIHFDPWWNISAQNQATDRAYRIGQKENVLVYQLLMKDSIEAKIYDMQKNKKQMSDLFVENSVGGISSMTKDELKDLFKMK